MRRVAWIPSGIREFIEGDPFGLASRVCFFAASGDGVSSPKKGRQSTVRRKLLIQLEPGRAAFQLRPLPPLLGAPS